MADLTLIRLMEVMKACAGEGEGLDLNSDFGDRTFADLGYDSLAVIETVTRIEREYDVHLDEGEVMDAPTPAALLGLISQAFGTAVEPSSGR
ncbi:acyl carrier protein [Streptomyces griseus]|uniref:acyl carrier protein n=1 Tax=Streptomyces griseus TaxID=1911 RepID=UPI000569BB5D|nr:acyl carrier protein [Streptomyces griseus]